MMMLWVVKVRDKVGGPARATQAQPCGHKTVAPMLGEHARDRGLVGLEDAAQKASATSPRPSSNSRLPRRD